MSAMVFRKAFKHSILVSVLPIPHDLQAGQTLGRFTAESDETGAFITVRTRKGPIKARPTSSIVYRPGHPHQVLTQEQVDAAHQKF